MTNPYLRPGDPSAEDKAVSIVRGPAIALIVVSLFAIVVGILALLMDAFLVVTGAMERLEAMNEGPVSKYTQLVVRTIWGIALVLASSFILYGAIQAKNLRNYQLSRAAAIVCMVPMLGPCCILGIPFGIWAFIALGKPGVKDAFR